MSEIPMHYETAYRWCGEGEDGDSTIEDHAALSVGPPHSLGRYSPEHLLVVAAETCLANYVLVIARLSKLDIKDYHSTAKGELIKDGKFGYRFVRIEIRPKLTVATGQEVQAQRVLEKSHKLCLIARSLNCPVEVKSEISLA